MYSIINNKLSVSISPIGAEIKSIKTVSDNHEYLWQGSTESWNRSSPILFPIVGALNNNSYTINDISYQLTPHGFGRDLSYEVTKESQDSIFFKATHTYETLKKYPFKFQLILGYELKDNKIKVYYQVDNLNDQTISFSIGGHPGFNCPLEKGLEFSDYKLKFNEIENSERIYKGSEVLTGERDPFLKNSNEIILSNDLFKKGALIFDDLLSEEIELSSPKGLKKVKMNFKGFPYFGIWSWPKKPAPFICLEPWYGIDSTEGDSTEWFDKEGLEIIEPGESFQAFYTIEIV